MPFLPLFTGIRHLAHVLSLYPQQKRAYSVLHPQAWTCIYTGHTCRHLPCAVPRISEDHLLYKEYRSENTASAVSLRSFHRLEPKHVQLVKKLKFQQCLSKICQNPKAKVTRLNFCLENKCEGVKVLLNESVCAHEGKFPELVCTDRECPCCGVERVRVRLESELRGRMDKQIKWPEWELVKVGKSTQMEKVGRSGSVLECVTELLKELGPLYRHIPHIQFWMAEGPVSVLKGESSWRLGDCHDGFCREFSLQVSG